MKWWLPRNDGHFVSLISQTCKGPYHYYKNWVDTWTMSGLITVYNKQINKQQNYCITSAEQPLWSDFKTAKAPERSGSIPRAHWESALVWFAVKSWTWRGGKVRESSQFCFIWAATAALVVSPAAAALTSSVLPCWANGYVQRVLILEETNVFIDMQWLCNCGCIFTVVSIEPKPVNYPPTDAFVLFFKTYLGSLPYGPDRIKMRTEPEDKKIHIINTLFLLLLY